MTHRMLIPDAVWCEHCRTPYGDEMYKSHLPCKDGRRNPVTGNYGAIEMPADSTYTIAMAWRKESLLRAARNT